MQYPIRFVLVNTSHPGNIGSSARALKTMGVGQLYLVAPKFFPHDNAVALAAGADDLLQAAIVTETLHEALVGCELVFATTARQRGIAMPELDPRQAAQKIMRQAKPHKIAIIFGCERAGLSNEQLLTSHYHIIIPSNPDYQSLNLASAVQILSYEINQARRVHPSAKRATQYASVDELEYFYQHLELLLTQAKFLNPKAPRKLMTRLRRLFNRIQLEKMEVNILRGILTTMQQLVQRELPS